MSKPQKYASQLMIFIWFFIPLTNAINADELPEKLKWAHSAIVFIEGDKIYAEDRYGKILREAIVGIDDVDVIQAAIDHAVPAGHLVITEGKYVLNKSLVIRNNHCSTS